MQCFCTTSLSLPSGRALGFLLSDLFRTGNDIADEPEPVSFKSDLTRNTNHSRLTRLPWV